MVKIPWSFVVWGMFGKYAHVRLGRDDEKPEYSTFSWIAMLFSCGVGIGYLFWGVAEPLYHYMQTPYLADPATPAAVPVATTITFFHWGLAPWAGYVVGGLGIAYFSFRRGRPMTFASSLFGILGEGTDGPWGKVVNFIAAFATVGGISTSVGMGVMSVTFGFNFITGVELTFGLTIAALVFFIVAYIRKQRPLLPNVWFGVTAENQQAAILV